MKNYAARLPVLFIGHGSPMNAIEDNDYTRSLARLARELPRPRAVLCISAHWLTEGTWVTRMPRPKTIHDFYGFPPALFDVQYPAPGSAEIADLIRQEVSNPTIQPDDELWGLDHGTWSVLRHLYPKADVPVLQLSVYLEMPGEYHLQVGAALRRLREQGVLIVGSGNIVHNLRRIDFESSALPVDWALEFDQWVKQRIDQRDFARLAKDPGEQSRAGKLSVPTPDHWYPLLYVLGASLPEDQLRYEYEGIQNASISMRSLSLGLTRS